ncbi:MAG: hypothetical protein V3U31_02760 [Dehalococcoidia bacterium]
MALVSSRVTVLDISNFSDLQNLLVSSPGSTQSLVAIAVAFAIGASMVVLPCGFPSVFMVPVILKSRPGLAQQVVLSVLFIAGGVLLLAAAGVVLSFFGVGILELVSTQRAKMITSAILYSILGAITLGYALSALGFLKLPSLQARVAGPKLPEQNRPYSRSLILGAVFGGGMGIACPMPTYYLILGWVVAAASPLYGAVLMAGYGLGRVVPALAIGAMLSGGTSGRLVSRRMASVQERIELPIALVMAMTGAYLLVFFGGVVGLRVL